MSTGKRWMVAAALGTLLAIGLSTGASGQDRSDKDRSDKDRSDKDNTTTTTRRGVRRQKHDHRR